jgi:hypothetical protein
MSIKINGLKEAPKWYRYVEPGEEPDPRALMLDDGGDGDWVERYSKKGEQYSDTRIYVVPTYGPIPDGYEPAGDRWCEGMQYWDGNLWVSSQSKNANDLYEKVPYIRPIKPTPSERPLLTAADFMKDGPWWLSRSAERHHAYMIVEVGLDGVMRGKDSGLLTYSAMRMAGWQRTNDGEHWEDC